MVVASLPDICHTGRDFLFYQKADKKIFKCVNALYSAISYFIRKPMRHKHGILHREIGDVPEEGML